MFLFSSLPANSISILKAWLTASESLNTFAMSGSRKTTLVPSLSLGLITEKVELLAYKIAGLTYTSGDTVIIAEDFRELFVMTSPQRATIYINGVRKGVSSDVFEQIPLGNIRIEAEDIKYFSDLIKTTSTITEENIHSLESIQNKITSSRFRFNELRSFRKEACLSYCIRTYIENFI